jgi:hypothetical protein
VVTTVTVFGIVLSGRSTRLAVTITSSTLLSTPSAAEAAADKTSAIAAGKAALVPDRTA